MSITQTRLKELFRYDKDSGVFTRLETKTYNAKKGDKAGYVNTIGYVAIRVDGKLHLAHRLAWVYEHGYMPKEVDHINHNRADNSISNLREVDRLSNNRNQSIKPSNTSGTTGVYWSKDRNKWVAQISVNDKIIGLGRFIEKDDAIKARKEAEVKYGFHENHGKREVA